MEIKTPTNHVGAIALGTIIIGFAVSAFEQTFRSRCETPFYRNLWRKCADRLLWSPTSERYTCIFLLSRKFCKYANSS